MYYKDFFSNLHLKEKIDNNIICLDGVVGVGKSTLGEFLAKELGFHFFQEPVLNNPLLDKFYYDKKRYSFPLQIFFLNKRFQMMKEAESIGKCLMDRSIFGDIIFSKMLQSDDEMSNDEFHVYEELLQTMLNLTTKPKLMIYLKSSVERAMEKINERGRTYEMIVPREYWVSLNKHYDEYFSSYNLSEIIIFDMDKLDPRDNLADREFILNTVRNKLKD